MNNIGSKTTGCSLYSAGAVSAKADHIGRLPAQGVSTAGAGGVCLPGLHQVHDLRHSRRRGERESDSVWGAGENVRVTVCGVQGRM